jgi:hypothetical protein
MMKIAMVRMTAMRMRYETIIKYSLDKCMCHPISKPYEVKN